MNWQAFPGCYCWACREARAHGQVLATPTPDSKRNPSPDAPRPTGSGVSSLLAETLSAQEQERQEKGDV